MKRLLNLSFVLFCGVSIGLGTAFALPWFQGDKSAKCRCTPVCRCGPGCQCK